MPRPALARRCAPYNCHHRCFPGTQNGSGFSATSPSLQAGDWRKRAMSDGGPQICGKEPQNRKGSVASCEIWALQPVLNLHFPDSDAIIGFQTTQRLGPCQPPHFPGIGRYLALLLIAARPFVTNAACCLLACLQRSVPANRALLTSTTAYSVVPRCVLYLTISQICGTGGDIYKLISEHHRHRWTKGSEACRMRVIFNNKFEVCTR
jgi:hypothetical protein